ncbi:MAG: F0F1 ATP synthase subunit B [Acidimicrobiia bacterium]
MQILTAMAVLAAEEGEGGSNASLVLPEPSELIAGIIAFAIVFFFVWKWAMPTIRATLEQRRQAITGQMEEAEKAKREAENLLADYRSQLAEAKTEGNRLIEEARQSADQMRADILAKAEADAEGIRAKAREEAATEMSRALSDAKSQVGEISMDLAGKIVGESLDAEAHKALIDRYLADLERL